MKRISIFALVCFLSLGLPFSCESPEIPVDRIDEEKVAAFVGMSDYGVYGEDVSPAFVFDRKQHEMVWNIKASRFVIQDDGQRNLLTVILSPSEEESMYSVSITSQEEGVASGVYTMKMVKSEGETAWLWDVGNRTGIIILQ